MIKHLPGRHNQQSHAGQLSPDDAFIEAAQSIPTGILGPVEVINGPKDPDARVIMFGSLSYSCLIKGNETKITVLESVTPDVFDAVVEYAKNFAKTYGPPHSRIITDVPHLKFLPVLQKHNFLIHPENIDNRVSDAVNTTVLKADPDDTFAEDLYAVLVKRQHDIQASTFKRKVDDLFSAWLALPTTVPINSLNVFGLYKIQKSLAAGISVKANLDV